MAKKSKITEDNKNKDFVQLYRNHIDDIVQLASSNATAHKLLMFLIKHMDGSNALCASYAVLGELLGVSYRTVMRAAAYLRDHGWVQILKSGNTNVYVVNHSVAWTSYANQKSYCKFDGTILLSSTENAEYLKNPDATTHYKTIDPDFIRLVQQKQKTFANECQTIQDIDTCNKTTQDIEREISEELLGIDDTQEPIGDVGVIVHG